MTVHLEVQDPNEPPVVKVFAEFECDLLWIDGKYGLGNIGGEEIGLDVPLVAELITLAREKDPTYNKADPRKSRGAAPDFIDRVFAAAQKVRDELYDEWIVIGKMPQSGHQMVLGKTGDPRPRVPYTWPLRPDTYWRAHGSGRWGNGVTP